jgi:predicted nucleic acid-binding protein
VRLVLDASAAVRIVMRMSAGQALLDTLDDATLVLAPALFRTELANALWKYVGAGHLQRKRDSKRPLG